MVAIIKTSTSIQRILAYNENKVRQGVANCLAAVNYPKEVDELSFSQKLNLLTRQLDLNQRVTRGSVHISLNFDPSEKLSRETMIEIAQSYMDTIGFGDQPYLVYQHQDTAHPHLHLVSIKVRSDGSRIDMQNIGRNQSEKARKQIEKQFGLVPASGPKQNPESKLEPVNITKAIYGKDQTKQAIENVLNFVLKSYRYTSLAELNAVLAKYNLLADRGSETSRIYQTQGLMYRLLDQNADRVGVPIKASELKGRPTLQFLESRFVVNRLARKPYQSRLQTRIDWVLAKSDLTLDQLVKALVKEGIDVILQRNAQGMLYGITYVDHHNWCVFKGSDLGKGYSAKSIAERCGQSFFQKGSELPEVLTQKSSFQTSSFIPWRKEKIASLPLTKASLKTLTFNSTGVVQMPVTGTQKNELLTTLIQTENISDYVSNALIKTKRKRKKTKSNLSPYN